MTGAERQRLKGLTDLAVRATVVLPRGSKFYPTPERLPQIRLHKPSLPSSPPEE